MTFEQWIALAIEETTGPGNSRPYHFRVCAYLSEQMSAWGPGDAQEVRDYFEEHKAELGPIEVLDYPHTQRS